MHSRVPVFCLFSTLKSSERIQKGATVGAGENQTRCFGNKQASLRTAESPWRQRDRQEGAGSSLAEPPPQVRLMVHSGAPP